MLLWYPSVHLFPYSPFFLFCLNFLSFVVMADSGLPCFLPWQSWPQWKRDLVTWLTNQCELCLAVTCVCNGVHSLGTAALRKAAPLAAWRAWSNQAKPPMRVTSCPLTRTCTPTSETQPIAPSQPAQMPLTVPFPSSQRSQPLQTVSCKAQGQLKALMAGLIWLRPQEVASTPTVATWLLAPRCYPAHLRSTTQDLPRLTRIHHNLQ